MSGGLDITALGAAVRKAAGDAPREALPLLLAELEAARAIAWARNTAPAPAGTSEPEPLLKAGEMAALLQVKESWLREAARQRRVPCVRVGHYLRFQAAAVIGALRGAPQDRGT